MRDPPRFALPSEKFGISCDAISGPVRTGVSSEGSGSQTTSKRNIKSRGSLIVSAPSLERPWFLLGRRDFIRKQRRLLFDARNIVNGSNVVIHSYPLALKQVKPVGSVTEAAKISSTKRPRQIELRDPDRARPRVPPRLPSKITTGTPLLPPLRLIHLGTPVFSDLALNTWYFREPERQGPQFQLVASLDGDHRPLDFVGL